MIFHSISTTCIAVCTYTTCFLAGSPLADCLNLHEDLSSKSPCQVKRFRCSMRERKKPSAESRINLDITGRWPVLVVVLGLGNLGLCVFSSRIYLYNILAPYIYYICIYIYDIEKYYQHTVMKGSNGFSIGYMPISRDDFEVPSLWSLSLSVGLLAL